MSNDQSNSLLMHTLLVTTNHSSEVADAIREMTGLEPVIMSAPGMRVDRVITYFPVGTDASAVTRSLAERFPFAFKATSRVIKNEDWQNKWKEHFHPFKLTLRIRVVPSWLVAKTRKRRLVTDIVLDPGLAFGTGLHETTQFVARMIERKRRRARTLIDIGYGSGILSIIAAKLGYKKIVGIDYDENALTAARANAEQNGVTSKVSFSQRDVFALPRTEQYDFIAANLDTSTLLSASDTLFALMHGKSVLCISGISLENRLVIYNHFKKYGLRCIKRYIGKEWCGFLYTKRLGRIRRRLHSLKQKITRKK